MSVEGQDERLTDTSLAALDDDWERWRTQIKRPEYPEDHGSFAAGWYGGKARGEAVSSAESEVRERVWKDEAQMAVAEQLSLEAKLERADRCADEAESREAVLVKALREARRLVYQMIAREEIGPSMVKLQTVLDAALAGVVEAEPGEAN